MSWRRHGLVQLTRGSFCFRILTTFVFELPDEGDTTGGPFPGPGPVSSFPEISGFGSFVSGELFPGLESRPSTLPGIEINSNYYYFF